MVIRNLSSCPLRVFGGWLSSLIRLFGAPLWLYFRKLISDPARFPRHRGVVIADFGGHSDSDSRFINDVKAAIDLLARVDLPRFNRVIRELHAIIRATGVFKWGGLF